MTIPELVDKVLEWDDAVPDLNAWVTHIDGDIYELSVMFGDDRTTYYFNLSRTDTALAFLQGAVMTR